MKDEKLLILSKQNISVDELVEAGKLLGVIE